MSTLTASKVDEPGEEDSNQSSSLLSLLPKDVVFECLVRLPRCYYPNLSCVSKTLRSLVRSPELYRLRSFLRKDSVYVFCFFRWFTLRRCAKTSDYVFVPISFPSVSTFFSSAVSVGLEIYFIGGCHVPSTTLWILDSRSGKVRMGPSMKVDRWGPHAAVGVVDGKIYVIGGSDEEIQVEVFDPKSQTWEFAGEEKIAHKFQFSASLEGKVYMVESENGRISVYNPRVGISNETTERLSDRVNCVCVVDNVLYASFDLGKLMWFDTRRKEWRSLVSRERKELFPFEATAIVEYEGKLAVFGLGSEIDSTKKKYIRCVLIALDRVGEGIGICGKMQWSGIVAKAPCTNSFWRHSFFVSH